MSPSFQRVLGLSLYLFLSVLCFQNTAVAQWRKLTAYSTGFYNEVFFFDNQHGWITSFTGIVLRTTDGGTTWQSSSLPSAKSSPNRDICFVSTFTGFISGDDGIWKTTDAGTSWSNISPTSPTIAGSTSSWFIDANNGVLGFGGCADSTVTFCSTTDGGSSWSSVTYTHNSPDVAVGGIGYSNGTYYATGGNGKHWKSTDGGASWSYLPTGSGGWQEDLVTAAGNIFVASANGTSCASIGGGKIMKSANGGSSWTSANFPSIVMWGVTMYSGTDGWACGDNGNAFKTTDGGSSWTNTSCGMASADRIDDIHFTDATHGWAVGDGIYQYVSHYYIPLRDTIDFGDVLVGTKRGDSLVPVKSIGTVGSIQNWRTLGTDSVHFNLQSNIIPIAVPSCGSAGVLSSFQPKSEGIKIARVELTLLDGGAPISIVVKGRGVRPRITAPTIHKADTMVCNFRRFDTIPVRNLGSYPLQVDSAWFSDMRSGIYSIVRPLPPFSVPIGSAVSLIVQTDMNGTGSFGATLQMRNNDPDVSSSPWQIAMSGYRRKILYELDPDTVITIPSAPLRTTSAVCVRLANSGDGLQVIESVKPLNGSSAIVLKNTVVNLQLPQNQYTMLCFEARATDTLLHERRFWIRMQPCAKDTFIVVKFKATNPYIVPPRERTLQLATCGAIAADSFVVKNNGNSDLLLSSTRFSSPASSFTVIKPTSWPVTVLPHDSTIIVYQVTPSNLQQRDTLTIQCNDSTIANGFLKIPCSVTFSTPQTLANVVPSIQSSVCRSTDTTWQQIAIKNRGNVTVNIVDVVQQLGNQLPFTVQIPRKSIPAGATDTLLVGLVALKTGNFNEKFTVQYAECNLTDSLSLSLDVVESSVSWLQKDINLGAVPLGQQISGTIELTNSGGSVITIDSLYVIGKKFVLQGITLPLQLQPKEKRIIPILFIGDSTTGNFASDVVAVTGLPCRQEITSTVSVEVTSQEVVLNTNRISFGSLLPCTIPTALDSVTVRNYGTTMVRITQAGFADPASQFQFLNSPLPRDLAPGDAVTLLVGVKSGTQGAISDRLLLLTEPTLQTQLSAELTAQCEVVGYLVQDQLGDPVAELSFVGVTPCKTSLSKQIVLRNQGSIADTFSITSTSTSIAIAPVGTFTLQAGDERWITIDADLAQSNDVERLVIRSSNCSNEQQLVLKTSLRSVALEYSDLLNFQLATVGKWKDGVLELQNLSSDSVLITEAVIDETGVAFSIMFSSPQRIAPDSILALPIRFSPDSIGYFEGWLQIILSEPCPDTLLIYLGGDGGSDRVDTIAVRIGSVIGRWGEQVTTPLIVSNNSNREAWIHVGIQANSRILQPRSIDFKLPNEVWPITLIDSIDGSLNFNGLPIFPTGSTEDTIATITWEVLRGDTIATPISMWALPSEERSVIKTTDGNFILENYCDAHGRLLRSAGLIDLEQNSPNPFNQTTVIEFETPFNGLATLTITDLLGNSVLQPVNGMQVAGRQQITIDASDLSPGVYRYTLNVGLQTLSRWMIVAR